MSRRLFCLVVVMVFGHQGVRGYVRSTHPFQEFFTTPSGNVKNAFTAIPLDPPLAVENNKSLKRRIQKRAEQQSEATLNNNNNAAVLLSTSSRQAQQQGKQAAFVSTSAALAGFTDVLVLTKYGCFVNMMTGNLLKMTTAAVNGQAVEAVLNGCFVVCYMSGVLAFTQLKQHLLSATRLQQQQQQQQRQDNDGDEQGLAPLRLVAPIIALLFVSADLLLAAPFAANSVATPLLRKALQVPFLAAGFGLINSAAGHATGGTIFFALTAHLTKLTNHLFEQATSPRRQTVMDAATHKSMTILFNFLGGAMVAGIMLKRNLTILPVCTTLGLAYAALYAWYAPPVMSTRVGQKAQHVARRIRYSFIPKRRQPALVPVVSVDAVYRPNSKSQPITELKSQS